MKKTGVSAKWMGVVMSWGSMKCLLLEDVLWAYSNRCVWAFEERFAW